MGNATLKKYLIVMKFLKNLFKKKQQVEELPKNKYGVTPPLAAYGFKPKKKKKGLRRFL